MKKIKKICLFAGYDSLGVIHDYVIYYISELSKIADVYYLSDNDNMPKSELNKLKNITKNAFSFRHKKYDFGSWQELIKKIGWNEIEKYEQLILANDSCYGPMYNFKNLFEVCQDKYDFWGITGSTQFHPHIQSYFLVMNHSVIQNKRFRNLIDSVQIEAKYFDIVHKYEIGLSRLMQEEGLAIGSYVSSYSKFNLTFKSIELIKKYKSPLIKVKTMTYFDQSYSYNLYGNTIKTLIKYTNYDYSLIESHLLAKGIDLKENKRRIFFNIIRRRLKSVISCRKTKKGKLLVKICKIPVFNFKISKD